MPTALNPKIQFFFLIIPSPFRKINLYEVYPALPEIEETNPEFTFIRVDRDEYMDLAKLWDVYGIPSLVVLDKDKEIGRFVNRDRKTKAQINDFLAELK